MENDRVIINFKDEKVCIEIDINQPNLSELVHSIIVNHLVVTRDNIVVTSNLGNFDKEGFADILVDVHKDFCEEIDKFYKNIEHEIKTYYEDEELSQFIIDSVKDSIESE